MALPGSGPISLAQVNQEFGLNPYQQISMADAEAGALGPINPCSPSYPNGQPPNSLAEWLNYDNAALCGGNGVMYMLAGPYPDGFTACMMGPNDPQITAYTSPLGMQPPNVNENLYQDVNLLFPLGIGWYFDPMLNWQIFVDDPTGHVKESNPC